jgi:hypothetical protein
MYGRSTRKMSLFYPLASLQQHPHSLKVNELHYLYHSLLYSRYEHNLEDGTE